MANRNIKGHVDRVDGLRISGWVCDLNSPEDSLQIALLSEGTEIGRGEANLQRIDLLEALGVGCCNFGFSILAPLGDDQMSSQNFSVVEAESQLPLPGGEVTVKTFTTVEGEVESMAGGVVQGWAKESDEASESLVEVGILVGDKIVESVVANAPHSHGNCGFSLPIPGEFCDGRPHLITVVSVHYGNVIGEIAGISPPALTPLDVIRRFDSGILRADLDPLSKFNYESLAGQVESGKTNLSDLALLHEQLRRGPALRSEYPSFALGTSESPLVSIVIPVFNNWEHTYHCLASIALVHTSIPLRSLSQTTTRTMKQRTLKVSSPV